MSNLKQSRALAWFLTLPPWLWLAVLFFAPIAFVWVFSFGAKAGLTEIDITWTLDNYIRIFDSIYIIIFIKSFITVFIATFICVLIAYPVAIAMCFVDKKWQPWLLLLIILPFWINVLIRTYGLISLIRDQGTLNSIFFGGWWIMQKLAELSGLLPVLPWLDGEFQPIQMMNTGFSVFLGIVYSFVPFMILPIFSSMERLDKSYIEASLDLGASHLRTFFSVILPMTQQGLTSGIILVFIPALGAFFIPTLLGNPEWWLIGNIIERQFHAANDLPFGSALSFLLMYITFGALALRSYIENRQEKKIRGQNN